MEASTWYGNRITFFINEKAEVVFQELSDKRSCTEMMRADYGYDQNGVDNACRGQIINGEISFFKGKNYDCVPKGVITAYVIPCIEKHDSVFGHNKNGVRICNGKIPSENFENWTYRELIGTWLPVEDIESINE